MKQFKPRAPAYYGRDNTLRSKEFLMRRHAMTWALENLRGSILDSRITRIKRGSCIRWNLVYEIDNLVS